MRKHNVQCLLMGGQACVLYGAAEFSRDTDLAILADRQNLARLQEALDALEAVCIAVPPFQAEYLDMGLAVHFRCKHIDALNMRVDVMAKLRGVEPFDVLWRRRTTIQYEEHLIDVMGLPDLVQAKKTQREKDWPMIQRLVEAHYFENRDHPNAEQVVFWLTELRTPSLLVDVAQRFPDKCRRLAPSRELLRWAEDGSEPDVRSALVDEQQHMMAVDRQYWAPLVEKLVELRTSARHAKDE